MSEVLNTAFYMPYGLRGVTEAAAVASLAQDLICYDRVWIFSSQMDAIPKVFAAMGRNAFRMAMEEASLKFIRDRTAFAWPKKKGHAGLAPILTIQGHRGESGSSGAFMWPTGTLASTALQGFDLSSDENRELSKLVREATTSMDQFLRQHEAVATGSLVDGIIQDLLRYLDVIEAVPELAITSNDIHSVISAIEDPIVKLLDTKELGLFQAKVESGTDAITPKQPIEPKQLDLLHFAAADRFVAAQTLIEQESTLHTEALVEPILRARLHAPRSAAGVELDAVLHAEGFCLPEVTDADSFPFEELLLERSTAAAQDFRRLVSDRDQRHDATLVQEYVSHLKRRFGPKFGATLVRFLTTTTIGLVDPVAGLFTGSFDALVADHLIAPLGASYFVDTKLRRMLSD